MALQMEELSMMAYTGAGGGHHMWFYANTEEDDATAAGFFDDASHMIREYDLIYVGSDGQLLQVTLEPGDAIRFRDFGQVESEVTEFLDFGELSDQVSDELNFGLVFDAEKVTTAEIASVGA